MDGRGRRWVVALWPQPAIGGATAACALLAVGAAWARAPGLPGAAALAQVGVLVAATVTAYRYPLALRPKAKVYLASVPYYLLAVSAAPPLAALGAAAGALLGELSVRRAHRTLPGDIVSEAGRRALVVLGGALLARSVSAGPVASSVPALLLAAAALALGDIASAPLALAPITGESPGRIVAAVARATWLEEGAQYLLGLLGALAATRARWAPAALVVPLVVVYQALRSAQRARAEAEEAARALRHQALHDGLTGLPNRALLRDRAEQALRALAREGTPLALLLLDLDRFKWVNDTLGHQTGDALLREVAARLRGATRAADTVARLGGDEFAVLLPEAGADGAARVAGALRRTLDRPVVLGDRAVQVEASVGGALAPAHGGDPDALLRAADVAMYAAKRGRRGYALYDPAQERGDGGRLGRVAALREAIARGALEVHYQPTVGVPPGRGTPPPSGRGAGVAWVEALVRWPDGRGRLTPPGEFVPLAEETGLIVPLTRWVLGEALRQCGAWERAGLRCGVAVNLSAWDLRDAGTLGTVEGLLAGAGLGPERLVLEITESALLGEDARGRGALERLRGRGVRVALDDFGTGYASLAYLRELPVDELKVDRSFVRRLGEDATDAAIVGAIVALGHALGLEVVAEGVETAAAWEALARLGCDLAQGYYLSRPLPAAGLARWLGTRAAGGGRASTR